MRYAIGRSAFATEKLWHDILRNEFMHSPIINSAAAALEMAMLDIVGKALGRPIYDLLGGKVHDVLPAYANAWYGVGKSPQEIGAAAAAAAARGYRGLKFDPFEDAGRDPDKASIRKAVEIVEAVRAATGPDVDLMIDAHGRFSPGSAIAIARALEPCDLFWLEEPCDPENAASLAMVGRNIKARLATGERCTSRAAFAGLLETHEVDVLQPDIIHVGGIMEGKKIAAMADAYYIPVSFHNPFGPVATAAAVQLDACTTNFFMQEIILRVRRRFPLRPARACAAPRERALRGAGPSGPGRRRIPPRGRARASVRARRVPAAVHRPLVGKIVVLLSQKVAGCPVEN